MLIDLIVGYCRFCMVLFVSSSYFLGISLLLEWPTMAPAGRGLVFSMLSIPRSSSLSFLNCSPVDVVAWCRMMSHDVAWCRMAHRGRSKEIRANESLQMERNTGNGWKWPWIWLYFKPTFKRVDSHIFISWNFCSSIPSFLVRLQLQPAVEALATVLPGRSPTPVQRFIMIYLYHNHNAVYYRDPAVSALLQHLNPRYAFIIIHQVNGRAASDESFWRISSNCFS